MSERPDYIKCIDDNYDDNKGKTWCGRRGVMEFTFISIDHAAMVGRAKGRLVSCPECAAAVIAALREGE